VSTSGNVTTGNLTVNGNITYVNSNVVTINDKFINVANNAATSGAANGGGLGVGPVDAEYATLIFNNGTTAWNTNIPLSVNGNVAGNYFVGNGSALTSISGASVVGAVANATYAVSAGSAGSAVTAEQVTFAVQANITGVGTLGNLSVSGNVTSGNISTLGLVGIGTTVPQSHLSVGAIGSTIGLTSDAALRIAPSGTLSTDQIVFGYSESGGYSSGVIGYVNTSSSGFQKGDIFFATRSVTTNTAPTERVRIDSSGSLLVGKTSATTSSKLEVDASSNVAQFYHTDSSDTIGIYMRHGRGLSGFAGKMISFRRNDNTEVGSIVIGESSTSYNTSSDYRLKNSIAPMTGALAKVALLKPCTYKWNSSGSNGQGFIAHELAEVVPECVTGEKDAVDAEGKIKPQGVDTSFLVATLTAAIQEQQALITQLTARITALEGA
jgi:hypothetical protein